VATCDPLRFAYRGHRATGFQARRLVFAATCPIVCQRPPTRQLLRGAEARAAESGGPTGCRRHEQHLTQSGWRNRFTQRPDGYAAKRTVRGAGSHCPKPR
jgi:hypothetical protein